MGTWRGVRREVCGIACLVKRRECVGGEVIVITVVGRTFEVFGMV